jgi:hypothetical protein
MFDNAIKIAANSISELRKSDVFRVLDQNGSGNRDLLASYISTTRPDLAAEVLEIMEEEFGA